MADKFNELVNHFMEQNEHCKHSKKYTTKEGNISKSTPVIEPVLKQSLSKAGQNNKNEKHQSDKRTKNTPTSNKQMPT